MNFRLHLLFIYILIFYGCLGSFKKKPIPQADKVEEVVIAPEISLGWEKIIPVISSKDQVINLIGNPDFIDNHKMGEDWYYSQDRSVDYGLISFPSSGHLIDHVQYIKYPEWK
tara:strand:- start:117 stop:455 length:339 start_codon:yes stop_codon:yes gene_type:complete